MDWSGILIPRKLSAEVSTLVQVAQPFSAYSSFGYIATQLEDLKIRNLNYHNRKFRPISNSENGEVSHEMTFHYKQDRNILSCTYTGENILHGHLIGLVDRAGEIRMSYHQINRTGELLTGICLSKPERLANGKIRLHESWQWTSGDRSKGNSILEEI